jgi:hypothetical protein
MVRRSEAQPAQQATPPGQRALAFIICLQAIPARAAPLVAG